MVPMFRLLRHIGGNWGLATTEREELLNSKSCNICMYVCMSLNNAGLSKSMCSKRTRHLSKTGHRVMLENFSENTRRNEATWKS
jgi:hypothetical protein